MSGGVAFEFLLRWGDLNLVLAQRLGEWIGHAPALEEDLAFGNLALDLLGQGRLFLQYAGEVEGKGRGEDELAYLREHREYRNPTLVEQPNGDFGQTIVRQALIDAYQLEYYERLQASKDAHIAAIAAKAIKETRYHWRFSSGWLVRLGDGTAESQRRMQSALDRLWPLTHELFAEDAIDRDMHVQGIAPSLAEIAEAWSKRFDALLIEACLQRPAERAYLWFGKRGEHSEHLGYLLADLQHMQRTYPGVHW